jgi:hypothetical protein
VAGSGKSASTLKLCAALRDEGLRPVRIRMRDLSLDPRMSLMEDVAQALVQNSGDDDFDRDNGSRPAAAEITDSGLQWLKGFAGSPGGVAAAAPTTKRTTVAEAARAYKEETLDAFKARLMKLEPVHFEHFVKELLDAMDYEGHEGKRRQGRRRCRANWHY